MEEKKDYVEVDCNKHDCAYRSDDKMYPSPNVGYHSHHRPAVLGINVGEEVKSQDKFGG